MIAPPGGYRFVRDPALPRVVRLMQASWAEPCWVYDEELLGYHLRRPSVDPELLLGVEEESSGELVAYYAFMPLPLLRGGQPRRAVFGSFLTAAPAVRRAGVARAVQAKLLEDAASRGYEEYLAFCEVGAASNESIARSCAAAGLSTRTVTSVPYLALPAALVARRARAASGATRPYAPADAAGAALLLDARAPAAVEARHARADLDHRFLSPVARTYVLPGPDGRVAALAHWLRLGVRDAGRTFRNAYLRDFEPGSLGPAEREQFLADTLRAVATEGCQLVIAPAIGGSPVALLGAVGFRQTARPLNLLWTPLRAPAADALPSAPGDYRLDVF